MQSTLAYLQTLPTLVRSFVVSTIHGGVYYISHLYVYTLYVLYSFTCTFVSKMTSAFHLTSWLSFLSYANFDPDLPFQPLPVLTSISSVFHILLHFVHVFLFNQYPYLRNPQPHEPQLSQTNHPHDGHLFIALVTVRPHFQQ